MPDEEGGGMVDVIAERGCRCRWEIFPANNRDKQYMRLDWD